MQCNENCGCKKGIIRNEKDIQKIWDVIESIPDKIKEEVKPIKRGITAFNALALTTIGGLLVAILMLYFQSKGGN